MIADHDIPRCQAVYKPMAHAQPRCCTERATITYEAHTAAGVVEVHRCQRCRLKADELRAWFGAAAPHIRHEPTLERIQRQQREEAQADLAALVERERPGARIHLASRRVYDDDAGQIIGRILGERPYIVEWLE